jgi:hypothetical protein
MEPQRCVERVAVLLGTVQFRLQVKVNVPERATLVDAEERRGQRSVRTR